MSETYVGQRKKVSYAAAVKRQRSVASPRIVEREAETQQAVEAVAVVEALPRPSVAPWSKDGLIAGTRHFGPMCLPNPRKTATVKLIAPDVPAPVAASSCVLL